MNIYRIALEDESNLSKVFELLEKRRIHFVFSCKMIYLNTNKELHTVRKMVKKAAGNLIVVQITAANLKEQPDFVKSWATEIIEKEYIEAVKQKELVEYKKMVEFLEKELQRQLENKNKEVTK